MATNAITLEEALQKATPEQRKLFTKPWTKNLFNLNSDVACDGNHHIQTLKHNGIEDLLNLLSIRNEDLPAPTKPNPTAGQPDLPLGITEPKTIQSLVAHAHCHHRSNKKWKLLHPNDSLTVASQASLASTGLLTRTFLTCDRQRKLAMQPSRLISPTTRFVNFWIKCETNDGCQTRLGWRT